jgi:hypothetical protein
MATQDSTNNPTPVAIAKGGTGATTLDGIINNNRFTATQAGHGFAVNDVIKHTGGTYTKAQADSAANAEVIGLVIAVNGDDFTFATQGYVTGLTALTADTTYFLSPSTPGLLTLTAPSTLGQISKPILRTITTTTAVVNNMRGQELTPSTSDYLPLAGGTMTGDIVLADNVRVDLTLPTTNAFCTGNMTDSFASGYSSAVGDLVFFGSGGKWLEVDADAVATCNGLLGIALEAKTDTQLMKVALPGSMVFLTAWAWTVGATLYAGETLGLPQETIPTGADAIIKVIGFAVSADVVFFNPSQDQQVVIA